MKGQDDGKPFNPTLTTVSFNEDGDGLGLALVIYKILLFRLCNLRKKSYLCSCFKTNQQDGSFF